MKPSFTPCFFSNTSLYWLRNAITPDISTSLKVVSIAAAFWASFKRRAMVWRRRVIFTRSSRAWISRGADSAGAGGGDLARASSAASASPLVTRPSLPVPVIAAGSSLLSATKRCAEGAKTGAAAAALAGCGFGSGLATVPLALGAAATAPSVIRPSTAPGSTVAPSSAAI